MGQGIPIAAGATFATSTTPSANQVQNTYDYIGAGKLKLYALASLATVVVDLFVNGIQIARRLPISFFGATGGMDTSANLINDVSTLGGRVELVFTATTGTPTVDFLLTFEGIPLVGTAISRLLGRR